MNITTATKVITTKTHTASFSAEEFKAAALSLAKKGVGLSDEQIASSKVDIAADGEVTVELVEVGSEAAAPESPAAPVTQATAAEAPAADAPTLRTGFLAH